MPTKNATTESGGFSAEERAAMKERAAELRAEGQEGRQEGRRPAGGSRRIAKMAPEDRRSPSACT